LKAYVVGGAVRDELLGLPVADRDWVVVGSSPDELLAAGFKPVGRDFPVFLHPQTREEYALARTERKSGRGYRGFIVHSAPEVTLEEDLARRDLTINAMAKDEAGRLIDPFGGERDLRAGVLRHVGEAFAEDPVRILRVARFAARYGYRVAGETLALMRRMVQAGAVEELVPERVWQELARGLAESRPARMLEVLEACGALARLLPALRIDAGALERAARGEAPLAQRFALLAWHGEPRAVEELCQRLRVPAEARELALLACESRDALGAAATAGAPDLLALLKRADAFRRPERFAALVAAVRFALPGIDTGRLERALAAAQAVDAAAIARAASSTDQIPAQLDAAREQAIRRACA
jgi:tRNA nucleotidyltransferase (CCA-adding enzyme)